MKKILSSIKDLYNDSPWHASFTYPILYIFIANILGAIIAAISASRDFQETFLINISLIFFLSIYLTPLWVFVGLIVSKRKKPYLLSLIIGLGLLFIFLFLAQYLGKNLEVN
tara:strand:- start:106 stop:441 length:336 start_codon:yes stop_codon:yes gene_type:complete